MMSRRARGRWLEVISIAAIAWLAYRGHLEIEWNDGVVRAEDALLRRVAVGVRVASALLLGAAIRSSLRAPRIPVLVASYSRSLAFGVGLLWVAHPIGFEGVFGAGEVGWTSLPGIGALLFFACWDASLRALAGDGRGWGWAAVGLALVGAGLGVLPLLGLPLLGLFLRAFGDERVLVSARREPALGLGLLLAFVAGLARFLLVEGPVLDATHFAAQGWLIPRGFGSLLAPSLLVVHHGPAIPPLADWNVAGPQLAVLWLGGALVAWRLPRFGFAIAWFLALYAPWLLGGVDELVHRDSAADLPVVGPLLGLAIVPFLFTSSKTASARLAGARAWILGVLILAAFLVGATRKRAELYRAEPVFWARAVLDAPKNPEAWTRHASFLARASKNDDAVGAYRRALLLVPGYDRAHSELEALLIRLGRTEEARTLSTDDE